MMGEMVYFCLFFSVIHAVSTYFICIISFAFLLSCLFKFLFSSYFYSFFFYSFFSYFFSSANFSAVDPLTLDNSLHIIASLKGLDFQTAFIIHESDVGLILAKNELNQTPWNVRTYTSTF